jgi:histone H2A
MAKGSTKDIGLTFPVARIHRKLKKTLHRRVGKGAAVYLAAVLEYLIAEVTELSGNAARDLKRQRINERCIMLALGSDAELDQLTKEVHIPNSGVLPCIHAVLVKPKKVKKAKATEEVATAEPVPEPAPTAL